MIKKIIHDPMFLQQKSIPATQLDMQIVSDLQDTLAANRASCVGMAANMIGELKQILIAHNGLFPMIMINPVITSKKRPYDTEEGCLSLVGVRKCTRYEEIEVDYYDSNWQKQHGKYTGFTAQIIQHEMDHFEGRLI